MVLFWVARSKLEAEYLAAPEFRVHLPPVNPHSSRHPRQRMQSEPAARSLPPCIGSHNTICRVRETHEGMLEIGCMKESREHAHLSRRRFVQGALDP